MKIYFETFGCAANQASAETMLNIIKSARHNIVSEKDADVYICNSCTVKYTTEQKILHKIKRFGEIGKDVIVAGCMPEVQLNKILNENPEALIVGVNAPARIRDALRQIELRREKTNGQTSKQTNANEYIFNCEKPEGFLNLPKIRYNENIHICQISTGCNFGCSYCIVRLARGNLISFPPEEIVRDIKRSVLEGCREIWLTSQDNAQYGTDFKKDDLHYGIRLPDLLRRICDLDGEFKIRVGMMNPFSVLPILDDLADAFDDPKIYNFLHLPIQSASYDVLKRMNRMHKTDDVETIINKFRSKFPDIDLFTDIIVGFCEETDEDFIKTAEWVKKFRPDKVNISKYSPRPGTKAYPLKNLDSRIVKSRSAELTRIADEIKLESKEKMIGKNVYVFISKYAKQKGVLARTDNYRPVIIRKTDLKPGQSALVKITEATPGYFIGIEIPDTKIDSQK